METQTTEVAASSPAAAFEPPTDPAQNLEWRKTGELPAANKEAKPKEDSTPSKEDASAATAARTAPDSAPGIKQERAKEPTAADRLKELFADLKRAGLSPAELKTFKREAQAAKTDAAPPASTTESTAKPQGLEEPIEPQQFDKNPDGTPKYETWEKLDAAHKDYVRKLIKFESAKAVQEDRQALAKEAMDTALRQEVTKAKARYGDETEGTIGAATEAIYNGKAVAPVVKQFIGEAPPAVLIDVMYVLGSKPEELASFVELAKSNPGAAMRKFALLEQLVEQELAKGSKVDPPANETGTERDASGKFVSQDPPARKKPAAPPPPEELSTRGSAPPDPIEAAFRDAESSGDARAFIDAENRRDLARRKGAA